MKSQRTACLTEYEAQVLGKLYAYQDELFLQELGVAFTGYCQPQHLGGARQTHHGRTLKRLEQRGLCEMRLLSAPLKRDTTAYRVTAMGCSIWDMYCAHTGAQARAVPALRSLLMGLK